MHQMADQSVDKLLAALSQADQYPRNLLLCREFEHTVKTVSDQLAKRSPKLFCPELDETAGSKAFLVFWDLFGENEGLSLYKSMVLSVVANLIGFSRVFTPATS